MRKQIACFMTVFCMGTAVCACQKEEVKNLPTAAETEMTADRAETEKFFAETETASEQEELSFSVFQNLTFIFSSGAGGWATEMTIAEDGTFSGRFFDGEMGVTGEEYPNGTMWQTDFFGKFTEPVKVNDFTYSMQIAEIDYEKEPGTEEIIDGVRYCYDSMPYGLYGAEELLIYTPDAPLDKLPEAYRNWVGCGELSAAEERTLSFWGLYNEAQECGFSSYNMAESRQGQTEENQGVTHAG